MVIQLVELGPFGCRLNRGLIEEITDLVFLSKKLKNPTMNKLRTQVKTSIENKNYEWLVARIDNENEKMVLKNSYGVTKDQTKIFSDTDNDGYSWQRYPNGKDTDSTSDWSFRYSTEGSSN
ncbi:MAG: hypothetical protein ACTSR2_14410 [Candidatus Hodarchaeales archaeon]